MKRKLRAQLAKIHHRTARLVDINVDAATQEYRATTVSLGDCIQDIQAAQKDLGKIVKAITRIARATHIVEKVAARLT